MTFGRRLVYLLVAVLAVVLAVATLLLGAEGVTRYVYRDVMTTSSSCGGDKNYFYRKSYPRIRAERNAFGVRGANYSIEPDDGVFRVVVMGDSFAWGQSVYPYDRRFPEVTQKLLEDRGQRVEVINLGAAGRNLIHHIHRLDTVALFQPDFVLYQWFVNDVEHQTPREFRQYKHLAYSGSAHLWLCAHSALYTIADYGWANFERIFGPLKSYPDLLVERFADESSPSSLRADRELDTLLDGLEERHLKVGIVLFPHMISPMRSYPLGFLHDRVLKKCAARKIPCLDLREAYSVFGDDYKQFWANDFDAHPGEAAHRIAAEKIVEFFGGLWGPKDATAQGAPGSQLPG